jgi:hypothetical protein
LTLDAEGGKGAHVNAMNKLHGVPFARNGELGGLLESLLVWAVVAILVIRYFLALTGYPQLGGHGLHIAHMLWGGLFMLASLVALLALLGRRIQRMAAILGGIGFGTFIDELGKFITSDNNYFFRPTIALIYCVFVLLFLLFRHLEERAPLSDRELIANALDQIKEGILANGAPLTRRDVQFNVKLLQALPSRDVDGGPPYPSMTGLRAALERLDVAPTRPATALERRASWVRAAYYRLIRSHRFATVVLIGLIAYALLTLVLLVMALLLAARGQRTIIGGLDGTLTVAEGGAVASAVLSAVLIAIGAALMPRSRASAYRWFRSGILVALLLEQVFLFYLFQLDAMLGLVLNLVALATVNYAIAAETAEGGQAVSGEASSGDLGERNAGHTTQTPPGGRGNA